ncbi:hypothetical protein FHU10_2694 [Serratia fonticola]|jgi:hypothetical protein|uniref:DUF4347 domain-containing protein n=1 Tax=Serratia fonticola TaxID=47917 RepID=A0A559T698_SERFO|nr:hypothetical protein [Serratia fonticola]TQI82337.1 hypothetical protein FHU09_5015 [Serratia fonticola]TQI95643.1 hypothetical protein FHU11_1035 [Serratia fonticola]TVZ70139.1 hypothetical protein FHU10_2694 [Serratia fonticola]
MILIVCTDDDSLVTIANRSIIKNPLTFGLHYQVFQELLPPLAKYENLFIIAHGAFLGDNGMPVIGDQEEDFYLNGSTLYQSIAAIIPGDYQGNVYIDACESADNTEEMLSFAETFYVYFRDKHKDSHVFGVNGCSSGLIPLPDDPKWIPVTLV